eukprot:CAMPEP_0168570378 /NCGR_PEP_ID=MMETSP0413-20121227/16685_1 /TAXON_ID=136452 /ORGANISM="Filamoeba nolandi, Strain NC-AS-23-1" /LENGTH=305 /DNA_ID=CAMNT_0008602989 /DNA_START=161 /DNA_END=1075 /DNA_ORIENTATION=-
MFYLVPLWTFHVFMSYFTAQWSWGWWLAAAYTIGALNSFQIQILGHDAVHCHIFASPALNKLTSIYIFLPIFCAPFGYIWFFEHMWHHKYVVDKTLRFGKFSDGLGFKIVASLVSIQIANFALWIVSKFVWVKVAANLVLYALGKAKTPLPTKYNAPVFKDLPQIVDWWFLLNEIISDLFNWAIIHYFGWSAFWYLQVSNAFANGLHPLGMRNVQEHQVRVPNQPTYSIYRRVPFDWMVGFNSNHHVEHHDFPRIPWTRLPQVRKIAPEYYNNLYHYTSFMQILWHFLTDRGMPVESFFEGTTLG